MFDRRFSQNSRNIFTIARQHTKNILPLAAMLFASPAFAFNFFPKLGAQRIVAPGDSIYDDVAAVSAAAGQTSFAVNAAMSADEILSYLLCIDRETLPENAKAAFDSLLDRLNPTKIGIGTEIISGGIDPCLNPVAAAKSNSEIGWRDEGKKRGHFFVLPNFFSAMDFATALMTVDVGTYEGVNAEHGTHFNLPFDSVHLDGNFPKTAYLSVGARTKGRGFFNFQLAKGELEIGRTKMGSIVISSFFDEITYAKLSFFAPQFRWSSFVVQAEVNKYAYFHHIEGRPCKRVSLGFLEGSMVNAPLELRFLNPVMIFHGFGAWKSYDDYNKDNPGSNSDDHPEDSRVSSFLALTADVNPWKNLRIYGIFLLNQWQTGLEKDTQSEDGYIPNALGAQGGIEGWIPVGPGYLNLSAEALWTSPWLYISRNPKWSLSRDKSELYIDGGAIRNWMGSPFGPDAIACQLSAQYSVAGKWSAGLDYRFKVHGEMSKSILSSVDENGEPNYFPTRDDWSKTDLKTPTGVPEWENMVALQGTAAPMRGLQFFASLAFVHRINAGNVDGRTQFGAEFVIGAKLSLLDFAFGIAKKGL